MDATAPKAARPPAEAGGDAVASTPPAAAAVGTVSASSLRSFFAGAAARSIAAAVMSPVSVVKTRQEWAVRGSSPYRSTPHAVWMIGRTEGVAALYSGLVPTIVRDAPFSGIYYTFYGHLKDWCVWRLACAAVCFLGLRNLISLINARDPAPVLCASRFSRRLHEPQMAALLPFEPLRTFTAGVTAGALATLVTHPADVIKTRLQLRVRGFKWGSAFRVVAVGYTSSAKREVR
jgi:solute carrier family 25 protein 38